MRVALANLAQRANRVWAIGRDTYVRFCPNPGIGVRRGAWRAALSVQRGLEIFRLNERDEWTLRCRYLNRKLSSKAWRS